MKRNHVFVLLLLAMFMSPALMNWFQPPREVRASIVCPSDLVPAKGTIQSLQVFGDEGRTGRHHGVVLNGTVDSNGSFECTIPYINAQFRMLYVKEIAANPMGTATVNMDAIFDSNVTFPVFSQVALSSGAQISTGGTDTGQPAAAAMNIFMGSAKIRIDSATVSPALGKFTAVLVCRVTG